MRKFIFLSTTLMLLGFNAVFAQDTTALRFISISNHGNITFFHNDTSDFYGTNMDFNINGNATGHGLFVNPTDGLLYCVADPDNDYTSTTRKIYQINPLTGESVLIMELNDHTSSATITPDGRMFTIDGNGGTTPGAVNEVDLAGLTQTQVAISNVTDGQPRAMVYNPNDSSLYIYSSFIDSVFIMKVDDWTETKQYANIMNGSVEVHGGYYRDNQFWLGCYGGEIIHVNLADSLGGPVIETNSGDGNMALSEFRMLAGPTQIQLLPSSSKLLRSLYGGSAFQWYRNDTLIVGATDDSLLVTIPGDYKLLAEIDTSTNFIWSETIQVRAPGITNLRFIAITTWDTEDVLFFNDDTTNLYAVTSTINDGSGNFTSHGIFVNPNDGYLYGIADPSNFTARSLYKINPLTGQFDSIMVINDHPTSIAVTPNGRLFTIEGNGGTTPGAINEIDLANLTQTQVAISNVTSGEPRAMVYNPNDSSLYIYSSFIDSVFIMKVDDWTETKQYANIDNGGVEVHGGYYRDNQFWLGCYGGEIIHVNLADSLGGDTIITQPYSLMDLTEFNLLKEATNIGVCLNEPIDVVLHAKYPSTAYQWYKNDTLIPGATADSLAVPDYGDYKLLTEIDSSGNYIWSETVTVHSLNVPNVSVSATDTLWCAGDTITLTGSSGGTSQWYMGGVAITGADSNVYLATTTGYYNMTKTNLNGCTDSASVGITIVDDPGCPNNIEDQQLNNQFSVYPTPFTSVINISCTDNEIQKVIITDIKGSVLSEKQVNGSFATVDASQFKAGIYFLKIISTDGVIVKQIIKQ